MNISPILMNVNVRTLGLLFFLMFGSLVNAQDKNLMKAEAQLEEGNFGRALRSADKVLKRDSRNTEALMIKSVASLKLYLDPRSTSDERSKLLKSATKSAEKAFSHGNEDDIRLFHGEHLIALVRELNKEAEAAYKMSRYNKAIQLFKQNLFLSPGDTMALYYLGSSYWFDNKKKEAVPHLKQVALMNYEAFLESEAPHTYEFKTFRYLTEYYMDNQIWDTARMFVDMGVEMFPIDHILKGYKYGIIRVELADMPPSREYWQVVTSALLDYPADSFLITKQNALYLFLFKQALQHDNQKYADSLLGILVADKMQRAKGENAQTIAQYDLFLHTKPVDIFFSILDYATEHYHRDIFEWLVEKWSAEVLNQDEVTTSDFIQLSKKQFDEGNKSMSALMMYSEYSRKSLPKDQIVQIVNFLNTRTFDNMPRMGLDYVYNTLLLMAEKDSKLKQSTQVLLRRMSYTFVDSLVQDNYMFKAHQILNATLERFPKDRDFIELTKRRQVAEADFVMNYYGSRIAAHGAEPKEGELEYNTGMLASNCEPGSVSDAVLHRIIQRINYFRRNSGVAKPATLTREFNTQAQYLALLFEANKNMTHKPMEGQRCYTSHAKSAAEFVLPVKGSNPSLAITSIMGDKNESVGNRRWLQFPLSANLGFGGGPGFQAFWCVDFGATADTSYYKDHFIAWPNQGFVPNLFAFDSWSFSLLDNLEGAVVTVKDNNQNKNLDVQVLTQQNGYGLPTLVFKPKVNIRREEQEERQFTVTITLANKRKFSYTVTFFSPTLPTQTEEQD